MYEQTGIITAADVPDFNSLRTRVNAVLNDGNSGSTTEAEANFGYGQTPAVVGPVSVGDVITAAQWNSLFAAIARCVKHQGTPSTIGDLPEGVDPDDVNVGDVIAAFDGSSGLLAIVTDIEDNRLNADPTEMSLTTDAGWVSTRSTSWTTAIDHEFDFEFASYDDARFFFNTGGEIRVAPGRSGGTGAGQDLSWTTLINTTIVSEGGGSNIVRMNHTASYVGSTSATAIGFYNLTTSYQTVYNIATSGGPAYDGDYFRVEARVLTNLGTAGAFTVRLRVTFNSEGSGDSTTVTGTFTSTPYIYRAVETAPADSGVSVDEPTYSLVGDL